MNRDDTTNYLQFSCKHLLYKSLDKKIHLLDDQQKMEIE